IGIVHGLNYTLLGCIATDYIKLCLDQVPGQPNKRIARVSVFMRHDFKGLFCRISHRSDCDFLDAPCVEVAAPEPALDASRRWRRRRCGGRPWRRRWCRRWSWRCSWCRRGSRRSSRTRSWSACRCRSRYWWVFTWCKILSRFETQFPGDYDLSRGQTVALANVVGHFAHEISGKVVAFEPLGFLFHQVQNAIYVLVAPFQILAGLHRRSQGKEESGD